MTPFKWSLLAAAIAQALIVVPAMADPPDADNARRTTPVTTQDDADSASSQTTSSQPRTTLGAVTVTAQRRTQKLQDVPIATSVINSVELENRGITSVADLGSVAPNVTVSHAPGDVTAAQIAIRGSVTVNPALYWEPAVGMYVDGVYMGKVQGAVFDLLDLKRIEVLRGPQGTLYGRNTLAGAVNFVTAKPTGVFTGSGVIKLGNYNSRVAKFMTDLPAIGKLKVSVGGLMKRHDGWIDAAPGSSVSQMNNVHTNAGYVRALYEATDNLSFDYRFDTTHVDQISRAGQVLRSDVYTMFGIPGIEPKSGRQTTAGADAPMFERMKAKGHALTVTWNAGNVGTFKYILSHRTMDWDDALDLDGTKVSFAAIERFSDYQQTSNELQWLGSSGPANWVLGLYRFDDHGFTDNPQTYFLGTANYDGNYGFATTSRAIYGQLSYKLTDHLTVSAGLRRSIEEKKAKRYLAIVGGPTLIPRNTRAKTTFGSTTPMFNVSYRFNPSVMAYVRYAKGFKSGGFNGEAQTVHDATTPFMPEKMESYEAGIKSMLFGKRLRLDATVFYNRNIDMQESVFTAKGSAASTILNAGRARTYGVEIDAVALISPNLKIRFNYGYLDKKYSEFIDRGVNVADNRAMVFAPHNTGSVVIDATFARTSTGVLRGLLDYRYTSAYYQYPYQLHLVNPTAQLARYSRIEPYGQLNAKLSLADMPWGQGIYGHVSLWVRNVADKEHVQSSIDFGPGFGNLLVGYYNVPRTYGISVGVKW
ncbi:MAG TPA: TonB-dependent receptor [Oleiagrimonas sp.]|nr:TonB-dependent receptor [Oleiagrimonas sp.]